ncbi:MAG: aminotransferase class I/II-fold pyridoxal phosphate-dependent enzyme [Sedimenticola sp.]|uniref:Aminotransferase class I/II-fold pyridoxal phosphate-dependent enzyme n=1 Tax=Sedimenticola thiotaurini TaxID=1543721 RepID=A0A558D0N7_9GAMM|nr:aminotransferase class I/II-fold pyridoxal phosphate-dependent enzyme [Sedimenticola sp.]MCW8950283.1 aminotransferase class I/II-fold pyridoxal phosphate-dependent enzyme [Sedimenticola sp.]MCW8975009.1 aminotransferase class I/II-fold pyridoxal phosphate-dependent enzyme [Sedimenticola sp.]TVT54565.1 MAG: aminotransferase class I/II-fold pyridoxal phosphate-dependent enzyme [Sedimenticola thiotaurini]
MNSPNKSLQKNAAIVAEALSEYIESSGTKQAPVIHQEKLEVLIERLGLEQHITEGDLSGEKLRAFVTDYLDATTRLHHPGFLAHQVAVPNLTGALGSWIDGSTNNAMAIYEMGPAASSIEYFMINWMLSKIGWTTVSSDRQLDPDSSHGGGVLTHGGSLANLTALLAARSARVPGFWKSGNPGNLVILVPEQSHYSMKRAAAILGLGEDNCLSLPADQDGRVLPAEMESQINELASRGKRVMAIVANACGTAAGLYDPLPEIAAICRQHNIWLHVDAAHGGGALVSAQLRHLLKGIELADSVVWDAHKMMCTPTVCAAVLVRDHRHLDHAFEQEASYLLHAKDQPGFDFISRTVECTKAGLGLRLFMTVAAMGESGLAAHVEGLVEQARSAAKLIQDRAGFEVAITPETNIVCFRLGDDDSQQLEIRRQLLEHGDYYISSTLYRNIRWLRLVFMNPLTSLDDIRQLLDDIEEIHSHLV